MKVLARNPPLHKRIRTDGFTVSMKQWTFRYVECTMVFSPQQLRFFCTFPQVCTGWGGGCGQSSNDTNAGCAACGYLSHMLMAAFLPSLYQSLPLFFPAFPDYFSKRHLSTRSLSFSVHLPPPPNTRIACNPTLELQALYFLTLFFYSEILISTLMFSGPCWIRYSNPSSTRVSRINI